MCEEQGERDSSPPPPAAETAAKSVPKHLGTDFALSHFPLHRQQCVGQDSLEDLQKSRLGGERRRDERGGGEVRREGWGAEMM